MSMPVIVSVCLGRIKKQNVHYYFLALLQKQTSNNVQICNTAVKVRSRIIYFEGFFWWWVIKTAGDIQLNFTILGLFTFDNNN